MKIVKITIYAILAIGVLFYPAPSQEAEGDCGTVRQCAQTAIEIAARVDAAVKVLQNKAAYKFVRLYDGQKIPDGPLSFTTAGSLQLVIVSGSMYFYGSNQAAMLDVHLDGNKIGQLRMFQNEGTRHLAFPAQLFSISSQPNSTHVLEFRPTPGTVSDLADSFYVVVLDF